MERRRGDGFDSSAGKQKLGQLMVAFPHMSGASRHRKTYTINQGEKEGEGEGEGECMKSPVQTK